MTSNRFERNNEPIYCRVVACREALNDGKEWSYYLINDSRASIDLAVLDEISYEWGDFGNTEMADVHVANIAPGAYVLIWRDDGGGAELRMEFSLLLKMRDREARLRFEFPKLYRLTNLPLVESLGKPGWQVAAVGKY
jgi:hypothetical protein